ncbi:MAG: UTP--glucose-1-phosphate uridylyltransferase [Chlamydiales bacterium]
MSILSELSYLYQIGQKHLLDDCSKWPLILQKQFVKQMTHFSIDLFQEQQIPLDCSNRFLPLLNNPNRVMKKTKTLHAMGKAILQEKKVGLILLAGGQGSRLGFPGPKGCMPLPKLQKRTLLSIILNKCASLQKKIRAELPIAIMTSSSNYSYIQTYLKEKDFFSLSKEQITIFQQKCFPLLDMERNWYIQSPGLLGQGPGGNGAAFGEGTSILQKWKAEGIEWVQVIPIDNPLSTPFDPYLLGCHVFDQSDLVLLTIKRDSDITEVGLIGENNGKIFIHEYLDLDLEVNLLFAYIGVFSCSIDLALQWKNSLPWHAVKKKGFIYRQEGHQEIQKVWKLEKFLFDIFSLSNKHSILLGKKEDCFAPIKSLRGRYSIELAENYFLQYENFAKYH